MQALIKRYWSCFAVLACLLPFLPGLGGPFLHDDAFNLGNLKIGPFSLESALDVAFRNESGLLRRPLSNLSLATNLWLHGESPFGFKLFNLLLHGACGLALLAFLRALLEGLKPEWELQRSNWIALLAAMLWVIHPLQVSTTLYVVQRMAQWPTLFLFLLAWRFQRYLNIGDPAPRAAIKFMAEWFALLALAIASKENGALAPLLMAVLWFVHRAVHAGKSSPPRWLLMATIALPILAGAFIIASHPDFILGGYASREFTPSQRLLTEPVVLWHYLRLWFVPYIPWMGLYVDIHTFGAQDLGAWLALGAWLFAAVLACAKCKQWPVYAFAVLWFLAAHAMESTLLPLELVYEHRNYLALPGIALLSAVLIDDLARHLRIRPWLAALPMLAILSGLTLHRAHTWSSPDVFALTEYAHHPNSNRAAMMVLSRNVAIGDPVGTARILAGIKRRNAAALWPLTLDAAMQCSAPRYPVDWNGIRNRIRRDGTDNRSMQMLRQTAINIISGACPYIDKEELRQALATGFQRAIAEGNVLQSEMFGSYLAWIAIREGDTDNGARWLRRAAAAAPDSVEPLFDLAFLELNRDRIDAASVAINQLKKRQATNPLIGYRIDELDGYMKQAHAEQGR